MAWADPGGRQLLRKRPLYSISPLLTSVSKSRQSGEPLVPTQRCTDAFTRHTSIVSERKAFSPRRARRTSLHSVTSLLAQYDSFSEKLTFFQNSLLFLYIAKKSKNWKTVALYFSTIFRQSLFFLQPGRKNQGSSFWSWTRCWSPFFSIVPGSWRKKIQISSFSSLKL